MIIYINMSAYTEILIYRPNEYATGFVRLLRFFLNWFAVAIVAADRKCRFGDPLRGPCL